MIKIAYRMSDVGFQKTKPDYVNNENCLRNTIAAFPLDRNEWHVIADGVGDDTKKMIESYIPKVQIDYVNIKNGPGFPFMYMLDKLIAQSNNDDILYFIENDYIHRSGSDMILKEGIDLGAHYVTLYDHRDKYINADKGGNPFITDGGEVTQVFKTPSCWFKLTNSTTGTFAATVDVLKSDYELIKGYANRPYWDDFHMFVELGQKGRTLISPIPSYSTHGELMWLSNPSENKEDVNIKWQKIITDSLEKI